MAAPTRVLCVDDNLDAVETVGQLLAMAGCEVAGCSDGPTAIAEFERFQPDVCLLDLTMPGMDGVELGKRLKEMAGDREVRLVALTGQGHIDAHHRTHNCGFDEHLVKPVEPSRLVEVVTGRTLATA